MKDFLGFRFGNIHSKDLHLLVISSSNRYSKNLLPSPTDYTLDIPGGNGNIILVRHMILVSLQLMWLLIIQMK